MKRWRATRVALVALALLAGACSGSSHDTTPTTTAKSPRAKSLEMRPVVRTSRPPCHGRSVPDKDGKHCYVLEPAFVRLPDVQSVDAVYSRDGPGWLLSVSIRPAAAGRFDDAMKRDAGRRVALVVDGRVCAAPQVNAGIAGTSFAISGTLGEREVKDLASRIGRPSHPVGNICAKALGRPVASCISVP
jgi:preprotein translocase subunit SecD